MIEELFIVVSYNNETTIAKSISSILQQIGDGQKIAIVENNSSDSSGRIVKSFASNPHIITYFLNENLGFGPAHNYVFDRINAKRYILINSDAYLKDICFLKRIRELNDNHGIIGLPLVFPDYSYQSSWYSHSTPLKLTLQALRADRLYLRLLKTKYINNVLVPIGKSLKLSKQMATSNEFVSAKHCRDMSLLEVDWVCGAAMIITQDVIKHTGGFDPNIFLYGEDEDICIEARKKGFKIATLIKVPPVVHEFGWGKSKNSEVISELKYTSLKYFYRKHFGLVKFKWCKLMLNVIYKKQS